MTVHVHSTSEPVGVMIRSKPDHVEQFTNLEDAWTAIHNNWQSYQHTILSVVDFDGKIFSRDEVWAEIARRQSAAQ